MYFRGNRLIKNQNRVDIYSYDLDDVREGDIIGIMKASDNTLHFYINGIDEGIAFSNLPQGKKIYK